MAETQIEWADKVWNPVRGCTRVSAGCEHCYAEKTALRFSGPGQPYEGLVRKVGGEARWTNKIQLVPEKLAEPLTWRKPSRVFVNSMSDLFHEGVPFEFVDRVFAVMALCPQHTFQVLTKRPQRMRDYFATPYRWMNIRSAAEKAWCDFAAPALISRVGEWAEREMPKVRDQFATWPLPNCWLGVSVEDQRAADERIPLLLQTPAAVRFLSVEPLLGPVDLHDYLFTVGTARLNGIHWVIVGGESGPRARPCNLDWIRSVVLQCRTAGVACFVKQLGSQPVGIGWVSYVRVDGKELAFHVGGLIDRKGGNPDEWPADLRVRQYPELRRELGIERRG